MDKKTRADSDPAIELKWLLPLLSGLQDQESISWLRLKMKTLKAQTLLMETKMQVGMLSKNLGIPPNLEHPDGLFCFEGANEHPIEGASPHQGQKYSSKPK